MDPLPVRHWECRGQQTGRHRSRSSVCQHPFLPPVSKVVAVLARELLAGVQDKIYGCKQSSTEDISDKDCTRCCLGIECFHFVLCLSGLRTVSGSLHDTASINYLHSTLILSFVISNDFRQADILNRTEWLNSMFMLYFGVA